jgi:hypothetical protein
MSTHTIDSPDVDLESLPIERLEADITSLSANIAAATAELVLRIGEFDRRRGFASWGCLSTAHWLSWQCGTGMIAAREKVRVGRALASLPLVRKAFRSGALSYSKVRAITRVATDADEAHYVDLARAGTASHVERLVRAMRRVARVEEADAAERQHCGRSVTAHWADDGNFELRVRLTPEAGAAALRALQLAEREIAPDERVTAVQRRADALVAVFDSFLAHGPADRSGSDRTSVVVHVADDVLNGDGDDRCHVDCGPALGVETVRRLCCDATFVHAVEDGHGELLRLGTPTKLIPPGLRRAVLLAHDRRCTFPSCEHRAWIDLHHVRPRVQGGATDLANLAPLCRRHHRAVHEGGFRMLPGGPARWRFFHPHGWELQPLPPAAISPLAELVHPTEKLLAGWSGERFDLHTTVEVLCGMRRSHDSAESRALGDGRDEAALLGAEPGG